MKIPRFAFEKFPGADPELTTTMKSVGEAMAMGRSFVEALQKAMRSLEQTPAGFWVEPDPEGTAETFLEQARVPHDGRLLAVERALRLGATPEQVHDATGIDPWFVAQLLSLVELRAKLEAAPDLDEDLLRLAKRMGCSDTQIAAVRGLTEAQVRARRHELGVRPVYKTVDTCAAEFAAQTPYHYSSYDEETEVAPSGRRKVLILGSGPNRIGQGIEFDYACVHASFALAEAGFETVMVNCNPETV